jgi:hypothetical protein
MAEKVCANSRIWSSARPERAVRRNAASASVYSSAGVAATRWRGANRKRVSGDANALPQKNRIKRGVFECSALAMRKSARSRRRDARKLPVRTAGSRSGRGRKYFCKTVDTSKKRD